MNLKKEIAAGAAALLLIGSVMNVSAAELSSSDYVNTLIKSNQESLIIDVNAYKAAYADLAKAFGNDTSAYVNHYLTAGVYEGRTKGVLFDPLIYVNAYSDVKETLGYDIAAIVDHYLTCGIQEKRTQGTTHGYADIAAAEAAGVQNTNVNRDVKNTDNSVSATANTPAKGGNNVSSTNSSASNGNSPTGNGVPNNNSAANSSTSNDNSNIADNATPSGSNNVGTPAPSSNASASSSSSSNNNTVATNNSTAPANTSNNVSAPVKDYDRTTSIYDNDGVTLIRVEYYDENNHLFKYSSVTDFDSSTNSYKENIYHHDDETNTEVLDRTDTYQNGQFVSSEN